MTTTTVISKDGTTIGYDRRGSGPAVVLVDGALCYRGSSPNDPLAALLARHFTVYRYDRRGRGQSGDTPPYSVEREVEDLAAVIEEAGGSAMVYGISSGAGLVLEAARSGLPITRLALYEAPFVVDATRPAVPDDVVVRLSELVSSGRRGDAVRLFMREGVALPGFVVAMMRFMPAWKRLTAVAHTLPYDLSVMSGTQGGRPLPAERWASVTVPTLVSYGSKSPEWMRNGTKAAAKALPSARLEVLPGQTHIVRATALQPLLTSFFKGA